MLTAAGRETERYLNIESIEKFPCTDLHTIDQLWLKYSNGRFGFSVQKRILESFWESFGKNPDADYKKFCCFGERLGWRVNDRWLNNDDELTFTLNAPVGHLPVYPCLGWLRRRPSSLWCVSSLAWRLVECNI
jgi:hypothetical protein